MSKAQELEDAEVGLSHKDADEQTFTEYIPHTFSGECVCNYVCLLICVALTHLNAFFNPAHPWKITPTNKHTASVFMKHPDPVVETASLSSLVPPKTTHKLRLCAKTITQGLLTNLQVRNL